MLCGIFIFATSYKMAKWNMYIFYRLVVTITVYNCKAIFPYDPSEEFDGTQKMKSTAFKGGGCAIKLLKKDINRTITSQSMTEVIWTAQ